MDHGQAPVVGGGREASHIGYYPTAHAYHGVAAGQAPGGEGSAEFLDGGESLGRLTVRDGEHTVVYSRVHSDRDVGLGDHGDPLHPGRQHRRQVPRGARANQYGVGPTSGHRHLDPDHWTAPSVVGKASSTKAPTVETSSPSVSTTRSAAAS